MTLDLSQHCRRQHGQLTVITADRTCGLPVDEALRLFVCLCNEAEVGVLMLFTKRQFHWPAPDMADTAAVFMRHLI